MRLSRPIELNFENIWFWLKTGGLQRKACAGRGEVGREGGQGSVPSAVSLVCVGALPGQRYDQVALGRNNAGVGSGIGLDKMGM
jgi:hypothetical protein